MASTTRGQFDGYANSQITGWAYDTDSPNTSVTVELFIDDVLVVEGPADIFRTDLRDAGIGDGRHAFRIQVPDSYFDSAPHKVGLRIKGVEKHLTHTPRILVFGDPPADATKSELHNVSRSGGSDPILSLILPTYNRGALMERTVRAYTRCARWSDVELIIVDDGSRDDTPQRLAALCREQENIRFTRIDNSGPGRARNVAAAMARAPLLLFVGDDVEPVNELFIEAHLKSHEKFPDRGAAILGKISWASQGDGVVNFVMQHVQGEGQQQFGYKFMEPYRWYDWRLFYSSNISIKKALVADWSLDGYDEGFSQYGFEDAEFGYRLTQRQKGQGRNFQILYVPTAVLAHDHPYTVSSFLRRQVSCGMMARRFFEKHPEIASEIGIHGMNEKLREPITAEVLPIEHYFTVFEGLKSWAVILEHHQGLGSQNWHEDFLKAIFNLAYCEGYLRTVTRGDANLALAARWVLDQVVVGLNKAIFREVIGSMPSPRLV